MNRIFYFSGTNNTKLLSEFLVETFIEKGEAADCLAIDLLNKSGKEMNNDFTRLGIGFPVHGFSMPNLVLDFIKALPQGKGREAFLFHTASDPVGVNLPGLIRGRKLLQMKGYKVIYEKAFIMGCNYLVSYSDLFNKQLYNINLEKIKFMVEEIQAGQTRHVEFNVIGNELMYIAHGLEEGQGAKFFGRNLKTTDECTICTKCVKECPVNNISITDGTITFGNQCMWCMKCMYNCPVDCIEPGMAAKVKLKDGYNIEKIIHDDSIDIENYELEEKYKKRFKEYFEDISK